MNRDNKDNADNTDNIDNTDNTDNTDKIAKDFSDIAMSSRIRLARNLVKYPFDSMMTEKDRLNLMDEVTKAITQSSSYANKNFNFLPIQSMIPEERQALVERHLISPELAIAKKECGVIISNDESISIMINEEDHLRIQSISDGFKMSETYETCEKIDRLIEENVEYAFSNTYGYLTCCPSNVGTGMRASVMLHLPALVMTKYIGKIFESAGKLGLTARGMYGENSEALGNMFQISNRISLGISENEILNLVNDISVQIIKKEREIRGNLYTKSPKRLEDKVYRSYGIFTNARIISIEESLKLLSDIRLGVDMNIVKEISREKLNDIMLSIQPGIIYKRYRSDILFKETDVLRADIIREKLK